MKLHLLSPLFILPGHSATRISFGFNYSFANFYIRPLLLNLLRTRPRPLSPVPSLLLLLLPLRLSLLRRLSRKTARKLPLPLRQRLLRPPRRNLLLLRRSRMPSRRSKILLLSPSRRTLFTRRLSTESRSLSRASTNRRF